MEVTVVNDKRVVLVNADEAILNFNYVEGAVYKNDRGNYIIPHLTSPNAYVADCWEIPEDDWEAGVRPNQLHDKGEKPVPVRSEDVGSFVGWLDEMPENKKSKRLGVKS